MGTSGNRYGFDISNSENDTRFVERDYSLGGGVTMYRRDFDHGFHSDDMNDRIRGTMGTMRGEHFGKGPRNWNRSDEKIYEDVCEALSYNARVDASDIEVEVVDSIVVLKGWVDSREAKKEAERCVEGLSGVKDVKNELHMKNRSFDAS